MIKKYMCQVLKMLIWVHFGHFIFNKFKFNDFFKDCILLIVSIPWKISTWISNQK